MMDTYVLKNWFLMMAKQWRSSMVGKQWRSSLEIFLPQNLKLFFLVTANAFLKSMWVFFIYFWWLLLLVIGMQLPRSSVVLSPLWVGIMCFFMQLSIRPSMREKTVGYFLAYLPRIILFTVCIAVPLELVKNLTDFLCQGNAFLLIGKHAMYLFLNPVYFFPVPSPMLLYVGYFIFDGDGSFSGLISAVMKGWKMAIYTYPFCLLSMGVMALAGWLGIQLIGWHYWAFLALCGSWIYYLWLGCWFNTMYVKKAHEDFSWY